MFSKRNNREIGDLMEYEKEDQKYSKIGKEKKIYILNNYPIPTDRIPRLEKIIERRIPEVEVKKIHYKNFTREKVRDALGIILSGSSLNVSDFYHDQKLRNYFEPQLELLRKTTNTPILAICYGFHLSAFAFGITVERMPFSHIHESVSISVDDYDELIPKKTMFVDVHHSDFVSPYDIGLKEHYEVLASCNIKGTETVQYMQHKEKPIFSVQFHPETQNHRLHYITRKKRAKLLKAKKLGEKLIENFVLLCLSYSSKAIEI